MLHLGQDILCQQLQGMSPFLRVLDVVEAEDEEMAEAADLVVDARELFGHGCRRADDPVVPGSIPRAARGWSFAVRLHEFSTARVPGV